MAFNPPLGTTTPEIFMDNVKRADELVNGPEGTVNDRAGEPLDTWRQMMAKNDEVRQNIIPLSRQYMTLEAAQADITNIPEGSTTYYRSPDDSALAIEIMNSGEALVSTGRMMISRQYVDALKSQLSNSVQALTSTMDIYSSVTLQGDTSVIISKESLAILEQAVIALGGDAGDVYVTQSGNDIFRVRLYPDESIVSNVLRSPYKTLNINTATIGLQFIDTADTVSRIAIPQTATPDSNFSGARTVFDLDGVFTAVNQSAQTSATVPTCAGNTGGRIYFGVLNSSITAAGYELTQSGILAYFKSAYPSLNIHYRTTQYTESSVLLFGSVNSNILIHIGAGVSASVGVYREKEIAQPSSTQLSVYNADIYNPSAYDFNNHPLSLKIQFSPGEVSEHSAMVLKDSNGTVYPCQFAGTFNANLRKNSDLAKYTDGSFNTGDVLFYGDIASGDKKQFRLEVYGNQGGVSPVYPKLIYDATAKTYTITVGEFTWTFSGTDGSPVSMVKNGTELKIRTIKRISGITAGAAVENTNFTSFTLSLINTGPLFSEVEQVAYHAGQGNVPAGAIRSITRFRMFSSGIMRVFNLFQATQQIPVNSLYGVRLDIGMTFGASSGATIHDGGTIVPGVAITGTTWSLVNDFSIGDQRRDEASKLNAWGAIRPNLGTMVQSGEEIRMRSGWTFSSVTDENLTNYVVPENWTWSAGHWIFPWSLGTAERELCNRILNRPVGMAYKGVPAYVLRRKICQSMERLADGIFDLYTNPDNGQVAASDRSGYRYPQVYGLLQTLRNGGDFEAQYAVFKTFINDIIGSYSNAGAAYLNGTLLLQFAGRMIFAPVEMYYRYAEKTGNVTIMNDLKVFIASICDALVTKVQTSGGVPLDGSQDAKGSANSNAEGMRMLALGVYAGLDSGGNKRAAFNTIVSMIKSNTFASFALPTVMESFGVQPFLNRWLSYECHFYYVYLRACKLLDITPEFNSSNYLLNSTLGNGSPDYLNYTVAEDRRGFCETAGAMAVGLTGLGRVSTMNAAWLLLERFEQDWSVDPVAQPHLADFRQLTTPLTVAYEGFEHVCNQFALVLIDQRYLDS